MTRAELVERMARAMAERHSKIAGGCFAPSDIPDQPDDCADGLCYCAKTARRDATAALAAIEAAGCVVVPREPTREMLGAMYVTPDFCGRHIIRHSVDKLPEAYRAMLAASPYAQEPKA